MISWRFGIVSSHGFEVLVQSVDHPSESFLPAHISLGTDDMSALHFAARVGRYPRRACKDWA